jgi:hypothetical protein
MLIHNLTQHRYDFTTEKYITGSVYLCLGVESGNIILSLSIFGRPKLDLPTSFKFSSNSVIFAQ